MATTAGSLPDYAEYLELFHRAFSAELRTIIQSLPITAAMQVLDVGCGDGFYTELLAERLVAPGSATGLDVDTDYLELANERLARRAQRCEYRFVAGRLSQTPLAEASFDFLWCAQSLYSLPEPISALRQMTGMLRPHGLLAVLENDSQHQLMLPWPSHLEVAMQRAEFEAHCDESKRPSKFYIGRRLPAALGDAGIEPLGFRTQCIDRQAPLDEALTKFLELHLERHAERVSPYLESKLADELRLLVDPGSKDYLLAQPYFTMSWINVLAWGRYSGRNCT